MDSVAVVSGGMDSVVMLHHLVKNCNYQPLVLIFDYGQRSSREVEFAKYHAQLLGLGLYVVSLPELGTQWLEADQYMTYVPTRNLIFLSIAASVAERKGVNSVYIGLHEGLDASTPANFIWDSTSGFVAKVNELLTLNDRHLVKIYAPLKDYTKKQVITLGRALGVDLAKTWSCHENREKACGKCPICKIRLAKFRELGLEDPLEYEVR